MMRLPEPSKGFLCTLLLLQAVAMAVSNLESVYLRGALRACERPLPEEDTLPFSGINASYTGTWDLTEGIPKYSERSESLHL